MAKILIINKPSTRVCREKATADLQEEKVSYGGLVMSKKGSVRISLASTGFLMVLFIVFSSAFYLFQVNDLAVKGYDIRELENRIVELEKENKQMRIREMELRSMYVIEKSVKDFNLVSPVNVSYLEINNAVAIR